MRTDEVQRPADPAAVMGILIVNKPRGITSRELVDRVARLFPRLKVGHAGTLDPLATGIMIVCVGAATRLVEMLQELPKSYRTVIRLGARSDTLDAEGRIVVDPTPWVPSSLEIEEVLPRFLGDVNQKPPSFSALKVQGQRAYDLARAGHSVDLEPRVVRIDRIAMVRYIWPHLELDIDCGSGTYIRSVARDMGEALTCGGLVETLVRTRVGPYGLEHAVDLEDLSTKSIGRHLLPALDAVRDWPRLALNSHQLDAIVHGRRLTAAELGNLSIRSGPVALLDSAGNLVGLGEVDSGARWLEPWKVLI
jgi:tRNA pseudouridine55 synthase